MQKCTTRIILPTLLSSLLSVTLIPPVHALEQETKEYIAGGVGTAALIGFVAAVYHAGKYTKALSEAQEEAPPEPFDTISSGEEITPVSTGSSVGLTQDERDDEREVEKVRMREEKIQGIAKKQGISLAATYAFFLAMLGSLSYLSKSREVAESNVYYEAKDLIDEIKSTMPKATGRILSSGDISSLKAEADVLEATYLPPINSVVSRLKKDTSRAGRHNLREMKRFKREFEEAISSMRKLSEEYQESKAFTVIKGVERVGKKTVILPGGEIQIVSQSGKAIDPETEEEREARIKKVRHVWIEWEERQQSGYQGRQIR